jgi:lipopolysaccharide/colanic/teichoic acid biosynthesis glycosyltransferase/glutathione synthase/RimK-type ligase-like ATP-grasp enzyme
MRQSGLRLFAKKCLDRVGAALVLLAASPALLIVAVAIRRKMGTPILFHQLRPGLKGKPFLLYKFRTMRDACDASGNPLSDAERLTPLGAFLRSSSLDEFPELWNVLRGELSLVGPRPLRMEYLPRYSREQNRRHEVMPGVTGWAQVNGRNALSWEEKFNLDTWYVDHWSLWLDFKILLSTVWAVAARKGIANDSHATMPEFLGSTETAPLTRKIESPQGEAVKPSILLTSAGRRTSLLQAFLSPAHRRGWRVFAGDRDPLAPALYLADDARRLPPILSSEYVGALLDFVEKDGIRLIVPTIDTELAILAESSEQFLAKGCVVLVSAKKLVEVAGDKWLTVNTFGKAGIATPRSWLADKYDQGNLPSALFVKPRNGSASQDAHAIDRSELASVLPTVPNAIIQERLVGPEITIDALLDLDGRPIHFVPRRRIRTMSGESIQGVTIDDSELRAWVLRILDIASELGGRGPLTLQAFLTADGPVLIEVNPRFGGGFPLTQAAGGCYPEWLLSSLEHERLEPRFGEYERNLYMTRHHVEIFTGNPLWK